MKILITLLISLIEISENKAITGTNIGGWLVIEPWITPSLFYRFLNKTKSEGVGLDQYTLCEVLGPKEGNELMKAHWDTWYTEDHLKNLSERGIEMVRLPIGDWTLDPYGPYVGCMDGAKDKIDWFLDTASKYNIGVLMDIHGAIGSQNGGMSSGQTGYVEWLSETNYTHWNHPKADWLGDWNITTKKYDAINWNHLNWSLDQMEALIKLYGHHPAFKAFSPVNEPWKYTDLDILKFFYRRVRKMVQDFAAPGSKFVFHDSFRPFSNIWNDLFADDDHENVVMDHHYYQAFTPNNSTNPDDYCDRYETAASNLTQTIKYDIWIGEWSLATDICTHWLNGFNDIRNVPQFECKWVDCPISYLPKHQAVDFDRTAEILGPFGGQLSTHACIQNGKCSTDSDFFSFEQVDQIAKCAMSSWNKHVQGSFFWTAHNEVSAKWDYIKAWDLGWINPNPNIEQGFIQ